MLKQKKVIIKNPICSYINSVEIRNSLHEKKIYFLLQFKL